jgi:hypothetical protein
MNLMKWQTGPRRVATQPRPKTCYKVYIFILIHTLKGYNQVHVFTNPISVMYRPIHTTFYSSNHESNKMTDPTKARSTPTKPKTVLQSLYVLLKDGIKSICLSIQYQSHFSHYIQNAIVANMNLMKWQNQPRTVAVQPRPRPCYRIHMLFRINTLKEWMQVHMFTNPISVLFWPLHTIFYSSTKYESIKYPTQPSPVAVQPRPRPIKRVNIFSLVNNPQRWNQFHMCITPIRVLFWHYIQNDIGANMNLIKMRDTPKRQSTPIKTQT